MRTIVLEQPGRFTLTDTPCPTAPPPGHARIRVRRVGVCGTDLHAFQGTQPFFSYPRILGHELGIETLDIGDGVDQVSPGDHCAVIPYLHCGKCVACRTGKTNCCGSLQVLGVHTDGGMREEIILPADKLLKSSALNLEQLALVETLSIGAHAVERAQLRPGENVLVIGAGPIGLSIIQFARLADVRIFLMERSARRIAFCNRHFTLSGVLENPASPVEELSEMLSGELPTVVFDATGSDRSMMDAFSYVANGGKLVFVGITPKTISFVGSEFHRREMMIISSRNARKEDLERVMRNMESGAIDTLPWISRVASPEEMIREFPSYLDPDYGIIKAFVTLDAS